MAKVKSIKFYNLVQRPNTRHGVILANFYDVNKNLIPLDFSKPLSTPTATYCETLQYIVTSDSSTDATANYNYQSFHTGNFDKTIGLKKIGDIWVPGSYVYDSSNWLKIEFKSPQNFSSIKICGTITDYSCTKSFSYEVEHEDNRIETHNFEFDYDAPIPITSSIYHYQSYDQNLMNSYLREIPFNSNTNNYIYDTKVGYAETLDTNNFRNIPINSIEKLKALYTKPENTLLSCTISFDKGQTWKTFNNSNWLEISDISPENIILNSMSIEMINRLDKSKLIAGGFTGDLDFKIAMKTNSEDVTPSITKIYIEHK